MTKSNRLNLVAAVLIAFAGATRAQEALPAVTASETLEQTAPAAPAAPAAAAIPEAPPAEAQPATPAVAQSPAVQEPEPTGWAAILRAGFNDFVLPIVLALAPLIAYFILRGVSVRLVLHHMMRKAPHGAPAAEEELHAGGRARYSTNELHFLDLNNTNGILLNGAAQERLERTEESGRRSLRPFLLSLLAGFVVWLAVIAGEAIAVPDSRPIAATAVAAGAGLFAFVMLAGLYCYWMARRLTAWVSAIACFAVLGAGVAVWQFTQAPWYLLVMPGMAQGSTACFLVRRFHRKMVAAGNKHLLILRVFGSDKSTAFTFGTLMSRWRFVGSFLTIVDPSYIRYQFAAISPFQWKRTAAGAIWYALAAMTFGAIATVAGSVYPGLLPDSWASLPVKDRTQLLMNAGYLIMIPFAIIPIFLYVTSRFAKSPAEAAERITKAIESGKRPRLGVFRGIPMWCFDDVWKPSVRHMLSNADAILMDLRGFTPERRGCAYEIGELIDRFPIERVLFLVHENADRESLYALIRERWAAMRESSPNCGARHPLLKVYSTHPRPKARQVRKDVARILGLLSACVDERAETDAAPKALVQLAS